MAEVVKMPKLGFDMAEGTLVRWVVGEGEPVEKGAVLAEIETDKATVEVEASASGVVNKHLVGEGTAVPVGEPIAVIGAAGEDVDVGSLVSAEAPRESAEPEAETGAERQPQVTPEAARPPAEAEKADGQYPGGIKASPVARRLAEERHIDLHALTGSGPGGRIVRSDVEAAVSRAPSPSPAQIPAYAAAAEPARETERLELSRLRAAIGRRMKASKQEAPHFYVTSEIDAGPLMALRAEANELLPEGAKLSVNDFVVKAAALSLREFPNLNASFDGEAVIRHGPINIGVAVAVDDGLLTVVVRSADAKPLSQIAREGGAMVQRAREGKVRPDDIEGATFTVSNLGMFDVENFVAIINPPEAAILAVGSVRETAVVKDGELAVGQRLKVTLSADHRVTDGAEAARWLQAYKRILEHPLTLML